MISVKLGHLIIALLRGGVADGEVDSWGELFLVEFFRSSFCQQQ